MKKVRDFLKVPADICAEFWLEALHKNNISLFVISILILIAESYNMARVLFWSNSGLETLNNRIYFGMYSILFAIAVLWHLFRTFLRRASKQMQWWIQYSIIFLMFLWHVLLNVRDLTKDPRGGTTVYVTAVLALGIFFQMSSAFSIIIFGCGYALFFILVNPILNPGAMINLTITTAVALSVSMTRNYHAVERLKQRKEINEMNARLKELAQRDLLTGILNKIALERRAEHYLDRVEETGTVALLIFDLDNFKDINDSFGHPCGDYVLRETAIKLKTVFHSGGEIGRIGGDEFAVVLSGEDVTHAKRMGEQMLPEISNIRWQNKPVGASLSIGICLCSKPGVSYAQLYKEADGALYEAKNSGKGRCCVCSLTDR